VPALTHTEIAGASAFLATMTLFPSYTAGVYEFSEGACAGLAVHLPAFGDERLELRQARCRILIEDALGTDGL
jgi:hypothetical protein